MRVRGDMKLYQSILVFLGNFSPIFVITYVVYIGFAVTWYLFLLEGSILCNLIWMQLLSKNYLENKCENEQYEVTEIEDMGKDVIAYFLTYSVSLPSVLFLPPEKGLLVLLIILILIFILFNNNKIMLFNPFLSARGYYEFEAKVKNGPSIYLVSKRRIETNKILNLYRLNEFLYLEKIVNG